MKNVWIVFLVILISVGAFFLGRRSGETTPPAGVAASAVNGTKLRASGPDGDYAANSAPVRTFRGPDGRAHLISYDDNNPPNSNDPAQVRKALLSDMKWYPANIERSYDLSAEDVTAMLAGTKAIPDHMLPVPGGPPRAK